MIAVGLLAAQEPLRRLVARRAGSPRAGNAGPGAALLIGLAAIYGGYFGAGVSVVVLGALALTLDDSFVRLNALKQAIALAVNLAAAIFFVFSNEVVWPAAVVMAGAALAGGALGGRLAGVIPPAVLRWSVVACGTAAAVIYAARDGVQR